MKKLFSALVFFVAASAVHGQLTINDPNAELRDAKNFHAISVSNAFDVFISQGGEETVAVSASEQKYRDNIGVEVKDGVLRIWLKKDGKLFNGWKGDKMKLKAYISCKNIDKLAAMGATDFHVQGSLTADDLTIDLSGASDVKEGKINAKKLTIKATGASDVTLSGSAMDVSIDVTGASDFKGYDFAVDYCHARATGASSINITVNKEISAHCTGASDIHYKGEGLIRDLKTTGASNVSRI